MVNLGFTIETATFSLGRAGALWICALCCGGKYNYQRLGLPRTLVNLALSLARWGFPIC
jgi:hypothetical protein